MKIIEARPNLENAITLAQQPVDLKALLAETNGKDQLTYYWSKAMDARPVTEDQQILAKARAAMETARQRGYRVPSGQ
jgi:hypothetical protein